MKKIIAALVILALVSGAASAQQRTKVRWFVGLGAGSDAPVIAIQKKVVEEFNKSQKEIELVFEVVDADQAPNTLATQIAGNNAPDIVGPVGIKGRDSFKGAWADLEPLAKKYKYDLNQFDKSMIDFYRTKDQGLAGLPYAIYPSFIHVNKALFKEAGIPLPPQKFGEPYIDENGVKKPWDVNTLREIAMKLTVDANGNDATSKEFDPKKIEQFGFGQQWGDFRGVATLFGAGSLVDAGGKLAQMPAHWLTGLKWLYDGMWKDHFYPTQAYGSSDILGKGDWFASGHMAMVYIHLWYSGFAQIQKLDWDLAVAPSYNGKTTAKMHADTFVITRYSKKQDAAFKAMTYLMNSPELLKAYGGMPANKTKQEAYLKDFGASKFPGKKINWQVVTDSVAYPDNPNHESWIPSFLESSTRYAELFTKMQSTPGLDLDAEVKTLLTDLNAIYKAAKN